MVLLEHLDREWVQYLLAGIRDGFQVGFTGELGTLRSSARNMKSVDELVQGYLDKELASGRIWEVLKLQLCSGARRYSECNHNLSLLKDVCDRMGMPLDNSKEEGPATVLTFLGMEMNSVQQIIQLPDNKLEPL